MCHMSRVTCHMSQFFFYFFFGQSGEAYRWRVCYQRGLPRLVFMINRPSVAGALSLINELTESLSHHFAPDLQTS